MASVALKFVTAIGIAVIAWLVMANFSTLYAGGLVSAVCKHQFNEKLDNIESRACPLTAGYPDYDSDVIDLGGCVEYMFIRSNQKHVKFVGEDETVQGLTICREPLSGIVNYAGFTEDPIAVHRDNAKKYTVYIGPGIISLEGFCQGTVTPCADFHDHDSCVAQGCIWSGSDVGPGGTCEGEAKPCNEIANPNECVGHKDCSWGVPTLPPPPPTTQCEYTPSGPCTVANLENTCFGNNAEAASSICYKESGGNPAIASRVDKCEDDKSFSWGLFQINLVCHGAKIGPDCEGIFDVSCGGLTRLASGRYNCHVIDEDKYNDCVEKIKDATTNINIACQISNNGNNWCPWATSYNCGLCA